MLSVLGTTFVEILKNEWLGLVASAFILISFLTSNQIKTRIINVIGCIVFVIYGLLLPTYSTAFMNAAVLIVHVVFLTKYFIKKHKEKKSKTEETTEQNQVPEEQTQEPVEQTQPEEPEEQNKE